MNLYEVETEIQVGDGRSTHFNIKPTFHISAKSVERAASRGEGKGYRHAWREYKWFMTATKKTPPITVEVVGVKLVDKDWQ